MDWKFSLGFHGNFTNQKKFDSPTISTKNIEEPNWKLGIEMHGHSNTHSLFK